MRFRDQTVFWQKFCLKVGAVKFIQEDVGENDKVE
jgi:hypothetical protein